MPPASTFNPNMLSKRQKRELKETGSFTTSRGTKRDATGATVTTPVTQQQASSMSLTELSKALALTPMTVDGVVPAETMTAPTPVNLPEPQADAAAETMQAGLQAQRDAAETVLVDTLAAERDRALKEQEKLNKRLEQMMQESDPQKRDTLKQEQRIIRNQLNAAETASAALEEDFNNRRKITSELDKLLTDGNNLIAQKRAMPISLQAQNKFVNQSIQDVQARAGVLSATISALDGNITQAHNIINTAQGTVRTYWKDQQDYNIAYMSLVESGALAKEKINTDYAEAQITLAKNKLTQLDETASYIQELMISPESAQFMADAGVTLNDSVDEINRKMAEQNKRVEINDTINSLKMEGYEYVAFPGDREDVVTLEVGGKTLAFVPPVEEVEMELRNVGGSLYRVNPQTGAAELVIGGGSGGGGGVTVPVAPLDSIPLNADGTVDVNSSAYIENLLAQSSEFKKTPTQSERESLTKFQGVIAQTGNLIASLKNTNTDPIIGFFKGLNPYDFDARTVNAQLQALVPGVARGVYGEVGVLTDHDIRNYMQTLPNLRSTEDQNKFVGLLTLKNAQRSFETTLKGLANSGVNVSGWLNDYRALTQQIKQVEQDLGVNSEPNPKALDDEFDSFQNQTTTDQTREGDGFWKSIGKFFFGE